MGGCLRRRVKIRRIRASLRLRSIYSPEGGLVKLAMDANWGRFKPDKEGEVSYTGISQSAIREMAVSHVWERDSGDKLG